MQYLSIHVVATAAAGYVLPKASLDADTTTHQLLFTRLESIVDQLPQLKRIGPPCFALDLVSYFGGDLQDLIQEIPVAIRVVEQEYPLADLLREFREVCAHAQAIGSGVVCTGD